MQFNLAPELSGGNNSGGGGGGGGHTKVGPAAYFFAHISCA
jgi:hypothetical protein